MPTHHLIASRGAAALARRLLAPRREHLVDGQSGFGLVEALVALVVLSAGMLGIASLHAQGIRTTRAALFRTQAITLAADMAERIRENRLGAPFYGAAPADHGCDTGTECVPARMAAHDLFRWTAAVAAALPDGVGTVAVADDEPPAFTIGVAWHESGFGGGAPVAHSIVVRVLEP